MNLFSHTEPLEHLFDDGFRGVFAGQVAERVQRIIHADRNGVQPKAAGGGIQCPGYGVPGAEGGGKLPLPSSRATAAAMTLRLPSSRQQTGSTMAK